MSDWEQRMTKKQRKAWRQFVQHTREDTVKKMDDSAFVMTLIAGEQSVDIKLAVEIGLAVLMDKPLMVVIHPDAPMNEHLRRVADRIVVCDIDTEEGQEVLLSHIEAFRA